MNSLRTSFTSFFSSPTPQREQSAVELGGDTSTADRTRPAIVATLPAWQTESPRSCCYALTFSLACAAGGGMLAYEEWESQAGTASIGAVVGWTAGWVASYLLGKAVHEVQSCVASRRLQALQPSAQLHRLTRIATEQNANAHGVARCARNIELIADTFPDAITGQELAQALVDISEYALTLRPPREAMKPIWRALDDLQVSGRITEGERAEARRKIKTAARDHSVPRAGLPSRKSERSHVRVDPVTFENDIEEAQAPEDSVRIHAAKAAGTSDTSINAETRPDQKHPS